MMRGALDQPDLHSQFESTFCKLISAADPASFGEVTKCQIDFTYSVSDALDQHYHSSTDKNDKGADYQGSWRAEFDISHVLKTDDDSKLLATQMSVSGNCFRDTYNMIHAESNFTLNDFTINRQIVTPEIDDQALETGPDGVKDYGFRLYNRWWSFGGGSGGCRFCAPDDRKFLPPVIMPRLTMGEHQAFEATFANCLRESGVASLAKVNNAHIRFAYTGNANTEVA
jgi:hypothetical protein